MPDSLSERDWQLLLQRIRDKKCTPFVGAGACAGILPTGSQIASEWAKKYHYPLADSSDLARVAQFLTFDQNDDMFPKEDIQRGFKDVPPPDFLKPDEPHGILADLNLPVYITTNYDSFMSKALQARHKDPKRELCRWNEYVKLVDRPVLTTGFTPSPANPLVYHLHGHYDVPQSLVLTEDDYIQFLVNMSSDQNLLPPLIRTALAGTHCFSLAIAYLIGISGCSSVVLLAH